MTKKELNTIIGKNIKKYRLLYNKNIGKLTQEDLAESVNCSVSLISNLESNKANKGTSINMLYRISIVLNVPISKFFEDTNE